MSPKSVPSPLEDWIHILNSLTLLANVHCFSNQGCLVQSKMDASTLALDFILMQLQLAGMGCCNSMMVKVD